MPSLRLSPDTLAFFIDETGHELLNDPRQKVFGLGGCSIMGRDLDAAMREPWRRVRKAVAGSAHAPLHASGLKCPTAGQIDAVVGFFRTQRIGRFGAICSVDTDLDSDLAPLWTVARALGNRIAAIAKWQPFNSVALIFEHSQRLQPHIEKTFSDFELQEDGRPVAVELCWMPKSASDPALEVADFIVNAIGAEVRHRLDGKPGFAKNFEAFFHGIDPRLASFIDIRKVELHTSREP